MCIERALVYRWRIESGRHALSLCNAVTLAAAFGITLAKLFDGFEMPEVARENRLYSKGGDTA